MTVCVQARGRIRSLEECILEAQEWECKILCVQVHYTALHCTTLHYTALHYTTLHYTTQDWLAEKDMLLTTHLEHDLTVEDLADETQVPRHQAT